MAVVGDRVQVPSRKVGEAPHDGVVTGVTGSLLRVRWSTGEVSTVVPSMGSLTIVEKQSGSGSRRRPTRGASAAKGQVGTQAAPRRVAASKQAKKAAKESGRAGRGRRPPKRLPRSSPRSQRRPASFHGEEAPDFDGVSACRVSRTPRGAGPGAEIKLADYGWGNRHLHVRDLRVARRRNRVARERKERERKERLHPVA